MAAEFMAAFFKELARDGQIDWAVAVARGAVRDAPDWWMPVLFMRLKSRRIWYTPGFGDDRQAFEKWPALLRSIRRGQCTPVLGGHLGSALLGRHRHRSRHPGPLRVGVRADADTALSGGRAVVGPPADRPAPRVSAGETERDGVSVRALQQRRHYGQARGVSDVTAPALSLDGIVTDGIYGHDAAFLWQSAHAHTNSVGGGATLDQLGYHCSVGVVAPVGDGLDRYTEPRSDRCPPAAVLRCGKVVCYEFGHLA
ncbi:MAG: hypothetical protein H7Y32_12910 [Chloroflexales bacterium]|nr:hypothetical protein [Chloroflexales bacterium]